MEEQQPVLEVNDYLKMVYRIADKYTHPGQTGDDFRAIAHAALLKAREKFIEQGKHEDPGSDFKAYAKAAVRNALNSHWKTENLKRSRLVEVEGMGDPEGQPSDIWGLVDGRMDSATPFGVKRIKSPAGKAVDDEREDIVAVVLSKIENEVDRLILEKCLMLGQTEEEVAAELGVTKQRVCYRLKRAKDAFRQVLAEMGYKVTESIHFKTIDANSVEAEMMLSSCGGEGKLPASTGDSQKKEKKSPKGVDE